MAKVDNLFPNLVDNAQLSLFDADGSMFSYDNYIAALIDDATDYDESQLSPIRTDNMQYYQGDLPALDVSRDETTGDYTEETINRSTAVSSEVQDTVMAMLPSLIRIFTSSESVAEYVPTRADNVDLATQQTDYVNNIVYEENDGFLMLHSVFKDAMINKVGVVEWGTDTTPVPEHKTFQSITMEQLKAAVAQYTEGDDDTEVGIVDEKAAIASIDQETGLIGKVTLQFSRSVPHHWVEAVPPEEFRIDRRAKTVSKAALVGRDQYVTLSDLVEKGFDLASLIEFAGNATGDYSQEKEIRTPGYEASLISAAMVRYGRYFIRVDKDEDGIAELREIHVVGDVHHIIKDEPVNHARLSVFCGDPRPHTVIGDAVADLVKKLQDINTQLLRGALDNMSGSLFSDTYVNEYTVNLSDALNDEVGKLVRVKGDPAGSVYEHNKTFNGGSIFEMMQQIDMIRQRRTGISEASKGIDPKALQSTNVMGIEAVVTGAQERIELVARVFAETGFKDLFKGLLREITDSPNRKKTIQARGKWVEIDTSLFDANFSVRVNPTLARGTDVTRLNALGQVRDTQLMVIEKFGPGNPIVTPQEFMNTIEDMLAISNIKNMQRYFRPITKELIESLQNAPKEPSPEELIAKAEIEKIKAGTAKALADLKHKDTQMALDEDFRRDKLGLDTLAHLITALQKSTDKQADIDIARIEAEAGNTRDVAV